LLVQQIRQLESALREFQPKLEPRSEPLPQDTPLSSTAHPPSRRDGFFSKSQRQIRRDAKLIRRSGLMDADWYRANYPDVAEANIDPTYHYLRFGASEGRDPSPEFKTRYYLSTHPDVAATEMNPLVHYLKFGRQEGRAPKKPAK
jgi:hypothetical protein